MLICYIRFQNPKMAMDKLLSSTLQDKNQWVHSGYIKIVYTVTWWEKHLIKDWPFNHAFNLAQGYILARWVISLQH